MRVKREKEMRREIGRRKERGKQVQDKTKEGEGRLKGKRGEERRGREVRRRKEGRECRRRNRRKREVGRGGGKSKS